MNRSPLVTCVLKRPARFDLLNQNEIKRNAFRKVSIILETLKVSEVFDLLGSD